MFVSILHRVTGDGMAFAALGVLLWWLGALAGGPAS
jgi:succinate dehydrogenase / fumarate reductase cytochrome b subunit